LRVCHYYECKCKSHNEIYLHSMQVYNSIVMLVLRRIVNFNS
jgi:hypothetical protein